MQLRDYQRRAVDSIGRCFADADSTLLVMPTGTGKTVTFAHAIREHSDGKRAMVLAHREELIAQNARTIGAVLGEPCDIERAELRADTPMLGAKARVIVASKDSLHPKRLARFDPSEFGLIITDESHHATARTYQRVYDHFKGVKHLGVTATPDRLDEEALGQVYASVAMVYEIADAIRDGWLVPVKARTVFVKDLQLADVATTGGDLNQGQLAEQLERDRVMHEVAASITAECGTRRAIVFVVSVRQAEGLAEILNHYRPGCASWVCGETPSEERRDRLKAHRAGETQFMVNVGVLTEGYDDPGASMIVVARPTKSRALFAQMLGRGTRTLPGLVDTLEAPAARREAISGSDKPDLLCLDFTGNCGRHKLVTPADVLGGKYPDEDREAAARKALVGDTDVCEALEQARAERTSVNRQEMMEYGAVKARIVAAARYLLREEDLFDGAFAPGRERTWLGGRAPTDSQLATLERHGFKREDCARMSRNECSKLIGGIVSRVHRGLCTIKQARALARMGVRESEKFTFEQARERLDRVYGQRALM